MTKMNYTKSNMQKRIAYESFDRGSNFENPPPRNDFWIRITFGKYRGNTLPQILRKDPSYVIVFLYMSGTLFKALLKEEPSPVELKWAHQLKVLANRAQNILVPIAKRDTHEFVILKDRHGVFAGVTLVSKGKKIPRARLRGKVEAGRGPTFDFSTPYKFENSARGLKRMVKSFTKIFFTLDMLGPDAWEINEFFANRKNFDLSKCGSHTSLVVTDADIEALTVEYRASLKQQRH